MTSMTTCRPTQALARLLWTSVGTVLFVLGAIGAVLPVMPTTVFWLGAIACFVRSHPAMAERLLAHPLFGPPLKRYRDYGVIDKRGKRAALTALALSAVVTVASNRALVISMGVCACLAAVALYIATRPSQVPGVQDDEHTAADPR